MFAMLTSRPSPGLSTPIASLLCAASLSACVGDLVPPPTDDSPDSGGTENPGSHTPDAGSPTADLWTSQCASCHGSFEGTSAISTGNTNGDFRLDAAAAVNRHGTELEAYIETTMPLGNAVACDAECAATLGALIRARVQPTATLDCTALEAAPFGLRELKLLTSDEYQRSLEDLLGVSAGFGGRVANNDGVLGGFPNMRGKGVNGSTLETYVANAESIASAAVAAGKPFNCDGSATCAARFVDEFLFEAFRGPVSDAQRAAYLALFASNPSNGMQLALEAALTSPYFLYRLEAGVSLEAARAAGYYSQTDDGSGTGAATGAPAETIEAASLNGQTQGFGELYNGTEWAMKHAGGFDLTFSTALTDPSAIEIEARGTNHGDIWPELQVLVGGVVQGVRRLDVNEVKTYRYELSGVSGNTVRLQFDNDSGESPYGPGQDANIFLTRIHLITASAVEPTPADPTAKSPLDDADATAWVLSPYELASTLAFMLTGSTPDLTLLQAARADRLTTDAQLRAQIERLIDSPRGREHVGEMITQWFELDEVLAAARPSVEGFDDALKQAMIDEVQAHFQHVFYEDSAPFHELYDGNYTFLNRTLAEHYGISGSFDDTLAKTEVEGRGGPIASGAFMTANAHVERTAPILRAVHARESALCHYIDPPNSPIAGDDIDAQRAAAQMKVAQREQDEGGLSSRDFYFLYTDGIDACAGCHEKIINPMFGMEDFDNVGRLRPTSGTGTVLETVNGVEKPVSLAGTLIGVDSTSDPTMLTYAGAKDFSNQIARTEAARACLIRKSFRWVTGLPSSDRDLDTGNQEQLTEAQRLAYACVAQRMDAALATHQDSPRAMVIELALEGLARFRR